MRFCKFFCVTLYLYFKYPCHSYPKYLDIWFCPFEGHLGLFADGQEVGVDVPPEDGHRPADVLGAEVSAGVDPQEGEPRGHHDEEQPQQEHEQAAAEATTFACELAAQSNHQ